MAQLISEEKRLLLQSQFSPGNIVGTKLWVPFLLDLGTIWPQIAVGPVAIHNRYMRLPRTSRVSSLQQPQSHLLNPEKALSLIC